MLKDRWAPVVLSQLGARDREDECEKLAGAVRWLESAARGIRGAHLLSQEELAWRDISSALIARRLRNQEQMPLIARELLKITYPGMLDSCVQEMAARRNNRYTSKCTAYTPARAIGSHALFLLDLSYCLATGQHDELYAKVRTSWQDSSPQAAFDWFVTRQKQVRTDQLLAVTEAQTDLIESSIGLRKLDDADAEDAGAADSEPDTLVIDRAEANDILTRNVIDHVFIPVTMARGRTSVEDKTTAALHQGGLEAPSAAQLALVRAEELSKTVDMGTEIKLAEFRSDCPEQALLPPWFFSNDLVSDMSVAAEFADEVDGPNHVGDGVACQRRLTNAAGPFVFPNAFDIPGSNHSIHLIEKGMAEQLPEWNAFWL
jgi:hypothetical protein